MKGKNLGYESAAPLRLRRPQEPPHAHVMQFRRLSLPRLAPRGKRPLAKHPLPKYLLRPGRNCAIYLGPIKESIST